MDIARTKQLAKHLHSFLQPQLGPAFKLGQAQELMATLAGLRSWSEVRSFPEKLESLSFDGSSLSRLAVRIEQQYAVKISPESLHRALVPSTDPWSVAVPRPAIVGGRFPRRWICDVCGEPIDSIDRAYVVWKSSGSTNSEFRIIHQSNCDMDDSFDCSNPLSDYLGHEGLNRLLAFFSNGPIIRHFERQPRTPVSNIDEVVDFIRRCQIPNYDVARRLFTDPRVIQEFQDAGEYLPYQPDTLAQMLRDFGGEDQ